VNTSAGPFGNFELRMATLPSDKPAISTQLLKESLALAFTHRAPSMLLAVTPFS
jgi:hypothetical protein